MRAAAMGLDQAAKSASGLASNEASQSSIRQFDIFTQGNLYIGKVIRADAGTYGTIVQCGRSPDLPCSISIGMCSNIFGSTLSYIPPEGSKVLVYVCPRSAFGRIIAILPAVTTLPAVTKDGKLPPSYSRGVDIEPSVSYMSEAIYSDIIDNKLEVNRLNANMNRALDLLPGNIALTNEQGIGLSVLNLLASLRATDKAKIEVSMIDDLVRMISGYFQHINAQGEQRIYNDGGFITHELSGTNYQCERTGFVDYKQPAFTESGEKSFLKKATSSRYGLSVANAVARKRFQIFMGYLGDIFNLFVANPDPDVNPMIPPTDSVQVIDQGLMQLHVDGSGRLLARSASGFMFQRSDRIPIPQRKREPWDPEGDKMEDADPTTAKKEATFDSAYPYGRSLQLRDAAAWYNRQSVQRLSDQNKDFYLPEEQDLQTPADKYDVQGKAEANFSKNVNKQNFFEVGDDGSITLRDAWGSCITLRGGCIDITCAGDVTLRSGKNTVVLAGHDAVIKAKKSVDVTATDNDLRLKAEGNLQMVCEGRNGVGGGILIESRSRSDNANFSGKGEAARGSGIVLKAESSRIFSTGRIVHLASSRNVIVDGYDDTGNMTGTLLVGVKSAVVSARQVIDMCVGDSTGLVLGKRSAALLGSSVVLEAANNVNIIKGSQAWIPLMMADLTFSPYDQVQPAIAKVNDQLQNNTTWLQPYTPDVRMDVQFTYRSSSEYGTLSASEIQGSTQFYTYQAPWAYMAGKSDPLIPIQISKWTEYPIADTYPWPGADIYKSKAYVKLETEVNIFDQATGVAKARKSQTNVLGKLKAYAFNEYEVVK